MDQLQAMDQWDQQGLCLQQLQQRGVGLGLGLQVQKQG
jgi:hypothetical protein